MKKPDLHVLHHYGIGDCLICKGILVELVKKYDVSLYYRQTNYQVMSKLYCPPQLKLIPKPFLQSEFSWDEDKKYINSLPHQFIGHIQLDTKVNFDQSFYNQVGIDIEYKWKNFSIKRDLKDEQEVYNKVVKKKHIFCHLKSRRSVPNFTFSDDIVKNYQIIEPNKKQDGSSGMFSWLKVIETAEMIFVTNSSFLNLIDLLQIQRNKMVYVRNCTTRKVKKHEDPTLKCKWEIV